MLANSSKIFQNRSIRVILAVAFVGLLAGVYFLFKPFPAGPGLEVAANVQERPGSLNARTDFGWNAVANPPSITRVPAVQKFDIGGGYMLETGSQGTRVIAPSARLIAVPSSYVQKFDIGGGYMLETGSQGTRVIAPSARLIAVPSSYAQRIDIGGGYMLEMDSQGTRLVASSARLVAVPSSSVQRIDIGGGYMLETGSQGTRVIAPSTLVKEKP